MCSSEIVGCSNPNTVIASRGGCIALRVVGTLDEACRAKGVRGVTREIRYTSKESCMDSEVSWRV